MNDDYPPPSSSLDPLPLPLPLDSTSYDHDDEAAYYSLPPSHEQHPYSQQQGAFEQEQVQSTDGFSRSYTATSEIRGTLEGHNRGDTRGSEEWAQQEKQVRFSFSCSPSNHHADPLL